jgi:hypothetical protein
MIHNKRSYKLLKENRSFHSVNKCCGKKNFSSFSLYSLANKNRFQVATNVAQDKTKKIKDDPLTDRDN